MTSAILIVNDFELACPFFFIGNGIGSDKAVVGFEAVPKGGFAKANRRWSGAARHGAKLEEWARRRVSSFFVRHTPCLIYNIENGSKSLLLLALYISTSLLWYSL